VGYPTSAARAIIGERLRRTCFLFLIGTLNFEFINAVLDSPDLGTNRCQLALDICCAQCAFS
jgi:hypothetical protein